MLHSPLAEQRWNSPTDVFQGLTPGVSVRVGVTSTVPLAGAGADTLKTSSVDWPGSNSTPTDPTSRAPSSPRAIPLTAPPFVADISPPPTGAKIDTFVFNE